MTGRDRLTRWTALAGVLAVAAVAAYVSYWHCVDVVTAHGEPGMIGRLYPVTIAGLIVAASMVLLDAASHAETAPALARPLLAAGIAVTLAANVAYGARGGVPGALWAAWPAVAFVGCYELMMMLVRASARRAGTVPGTVPGPSLNGHAAEAERLFAADIEAGRVPGIARIRKGLRVGDVRGRQVREHLRAVTRG